MLLNMLRRLLLFALFILLIAALFAYTGCSEFIGNAIVYAPNRGKTAADAAVPGEPYTFGVFKRAQALGDLEALRRHGQRALRVHLNGSPDAALERLDTLVAAALRSRAG